MLPILFSFHFAGRVINVYSYGVFLILAIVGGIFSFYWLLKKSQISPARIFDNILWTIFAGFVGARLFYILFHFRFYLGIWREIFYLWHGGLTIFGGLVFGFLVLFLWLYFRKRKELWRYLDCAIISFFLAYSIGMVGSFLLGSDFGKPSSLPWSVKIPSLADGVLRHPVQLYEALACLIIFIILFLWHEGNLKKQEEGKIFFWGLILFGATKFFFQFFREPDIIVYKAITLEHLLNLIVALCGIFGFWIKYQKNLKNRI